MNDHPEEAADIVAHAYNNPNLPLFRSYMSGLLKENYWSDGRLDYEGMNHAVEGLQILGQLKGDVDWPKYVDTSYLPADLHAAK
jgi:NitT/TauT family transport system substrate-binding protein